jgi:hypothetical protein
MNDQDAFRKSQPFELIPLNIEGAYTSPPVPDGFDAGTASPAELAKYGFHWSRPRDDQPELLAAWREIFGRKWKASDCIVPHLVVRPGKTHQLRDVQLGNGSTNATSGNWSGAVSTNQGGAPLPIGGGGLDGYVTPWNNQQHVNFIGANNDIYELYYNGSLWIYNDLCSFTGSPPAASGSPVVGYVTPWNNQQQVVYLGNDNDIHQLFWNGQQWNSSDLTQLTGAPAPIARSALTGYFTTYNQQQHINYIGTDYHVHELVWANGHWNHNDLTHSTGAPAAALGTRLVGYETAYNNQQHVFFIDTNIHVHELVYGGGHWTHGDHTQNTPGAEIPAWPVNALTGYVTTFNNQQHIIYLGRDNHVHELVWANSRWTDNDLTRLTGAPLMPTNGGLDGYMTSSNSQQHVNFLGVDSHVHELWYDGQQWHHNDLTNAAPNVPLPAPGSRLDGYETSFNNQQHVNFLGVDGHVHELWFDSQWHHNDLTNIAYSTPWMSALGTWNIPTISQPPEPAGPTGNWDSSSWVGIDGWGGVSNDVLQAGVEQGLDSDPLTPIVTPFYVAWFEWFAPAQGIFGSGSPGYIHQVDIDNFPVAPGQQVYCSVQYINNQTAGSIVFINRKTFQKFSITLAPPPGASFSGSCVEWIMEAPNGGEPFVSVPAFTPIVFNPAYGFDFHNAVGTPANGFAVNLLRVSQTLTSVAITGEQVTIKFIG